MHAPTPPTGLVGSFEYSFQLQTGGETSDAKAMTGCQIRKNSSTARKNTSRQDSRGGRV